MNANRPTLARSRNWRTLGDKDADGSWRWSRQQHEWGRYPKTEYFIIWRIDDEATAERVIRALSPLAGSQNPLAGDPYVRS